MITLAVRVRSKCSKLQRNPPLLQITVQLQTIYQFWRNSKTLFFFIYFYKHYVLATKHVCTVDDLSPASITVWCTVGEHSRLVTHSKRLSTKQHSQRSVPLMTLWRIRLKLNELICQLRLTFRAHSQSLMASLYFPSLMWAWVDFNI